MQEADVRVATLDDLAVELENQPQHAVRRRMLRPEIEVEIAEALVVHRDGSSEESE
jgi:hypothetical protein